MSARRRTATPWLSFHLFLAGPFEPFLVERLLPWLEESRSAGRLRRFFFIRYGEGGLHLRLRFMPAEEVTAEALEEALEDLVRAHRRALGEEATPDGDRLERHPYRRSDLYFGESRASVYSELMNVATTRLCLRWLRQTGPDQRPRLWLILTAALEFLLEQSTDGPDGLRAALDDAHDFALRNTRAAGLDDAPRALPVAAVRAALPRVRAGLAEDQEVRRLVRLLRRCRRYVPDGPFVATHALHLLANKLGFSIREELDAFASLRSLPPPAPTRASGEPKTLGRDS